jgi:Abortive infection alpha
MDETPASEGAETPDDGVPSGLPDDRNDAVKALDAAPGLLRVWARGWMRTAEWTLGSALRASRRLAEAAISGESATALMEEMRAELRENARRILGLTDLESRVARATGGRVAFSRSEPEPVSEVLRERGADLLRRAAELEQDEIHPAFATILGQMAPDEARMLRLLINEGEQPIVYVHRSGPLGFGAKEVRRRLSMVGRHAGLLHPDHVPAYLDNLMHLGLVRIARDPVERDGAYQVLEAQPEVLEGIQEAGGNVRARTSRRSLQLTDFGRLFCETCLPASTSEFEAVRGGEHS